MSEGMPEVQCGPESALLLVRRHHCCLVLHDRFMAYASAPGSLHTAKEQGTQAQNHARCARVRAQRQPRGAGTPQARCTGIPDAVAVEEQGAWATAYNSL